MTIARWKPPVAPTRHEQFLLKRLDRVRTLLGSCVCNDMSHSKKAPLETFAQIRT